MPIDMNALNVTTTPGGTTFADLIFGSSDNPWALVAIGIAAAILGMVTHWVKVYTKEEDTAGIVEWFFKADMKRTALAVASMLAALVAAFAPLDYTTLTAYQTFAQAWAIGYAADSAFASNIPRSRNSRTRSTDKVSETPTSSQM